MDYSSKSNDEMKLMHETKVYPPRVKMTVQMKSDKAFTLPIKVEGSNCNEKLCVDLLFPLLGMYCMIINTAGRANVSLSQCHRRLICQ